MKYFIGGIFLVFFTLGIQSCSDKDETPVDADDNFITSVAFTVGSDRYEAVIADNVITITVPYTVSLDKVSVDFQYTASAKVYPDPTTVTDWDNERAFRVVSYNGEENKYTYKVIKDDIRAEEDVTLSSPAGVAAFAEKGVTILKGNLIIGEDDGEDIESIAALEKLKQVDGKIIIKNSYKGTDLTGLDNITSLGGLEMGTKDAFSKAPVYQVSFRSLQTITGDLAVYNDNTKWIMGESLGKVDGNVVIHSASLQSMQLDKLSVIGGNFDIQSQDGQEKMGGTMVSLSFPELLSIKGAFSTQYLAALTSIELPKLSEVGSITFESLPMALDKISLPEIKTVNGDMKITSYTIYTPIGSVTTGNETLKKFEGFDKLEKIGGILMLSYFTAMTKVPDVSKASIGGYYLDHMNSVNPVFDFSKTTFLQKDGKECEVKFSYTPVTQIIGQQTMNCILHFYRYDISNGFPELTNVDVLNGFILYSGKDTGKTKDNVFELKVKKVIGNIFINNRFISDKRTGIYKFPNLESIGGYCWIQHSTFKKFDLLAPHLSTVGGQFMIGQDQTDQLLWAYVDNVDLSSLRTVGCSSEVQYVKEFYKDGALGGEKVPEDIPTFSLTFTKDGSIASLPSLQKIGGRGARIGLYALNEGIVTLSCAKLVTVEGKFMITGSSIPGPANADPVLDNLEFPALKKVGSVCVERFSALNDFTTFALLFENNVITKPENWSVEDCDYEPTYADMKAKKYKK